MLKKIIFICLLSFCLSANASISVCFTPGGECTDKIVNAIDGAKQSILVQAYSFTSAPIAEALVHAKGRGVDVRVILDKSQRNGKQTILLVDNGIYPLIDNKPKIAHNKIMIIDNEKVITGSFNFTAAAQKSNAENLLVIDDASVAKKYLAYWQKRREACQYYITKQ